MKINDILVTTDFSDEAARAYPAAGDIARKFGARLHLVHVVEPLPPHYYLSAQGRPMNIPEGEYYTGIDAQFEEVKRLPAFAGVELVTGVRCQARVEEAISDYVQEHNVDLVVVATHGYSGLSHLLLGSFAEKVIRRSVIPVLTVRQPLNRDTLIKNVLVPYDFSENARAVLPAVRFLSDQFAAKFTFIYVNEPHYVLADPISGAAVPTAGEENMLALARAHSNFDVLVREEIAGVDVEFETRCGQPSAEIVHAAEEFSSDLVLMATHGRSGFQHFLLGSVAEKVIRHAPCCVLSVRPTEIHTGSPYTQESPDSVKT